jgi:hypothetical protein
MKTLVNSNRPALIAWAILAVLTTVSWALGTKHGLDGAHHVPASLIIFVVAVFKVRVVGLYFMELRDAPTALRGVFEAYCVVLLGVLTTMYLVA